MAKRLDRPTSDYRNAIKKHRLGQTAEQVAATLGLELPRTESSLGILCQLGLAERLGSKYYWRGN